jgi:hypothetical protein
MDFSKLNHIAIICAALASFLIGGLWYSKLLFGKIWMRENGFTEEGAQNVNMLKVFGISFLLSLVISYNLAFFLGPKPDLEFGLIAGLSAGLGWVAMSLGILYLFERKSFKLWVINAGYNIVTYTVIGAIVGVWK